MESDSSAASDDDNNDSIFQNPKCKWTKEKFQQSVKNGEITPFYPPSETKTYLNNIMCGICYMYYPRINKALCCNNFAICSNCFIILKDNKCPHCKKEISIKANCNSDQFSADENKKNYPSDTLQIAQKFGLDVDKVKELLESGFVIEDLFDEDYTC